MSTRYDLGPYKAAAHPTEVSVYAGRQSRLEDVKRPSLLLALSSANQLYSGTGRVLFETFARLLDDFRIEIAIDDVHAQNVAVAEAFCAENRLCLHRGMGNAVVGAPDMCNAGLADVLEGHRWDIVMGVSWANAATNEAVLAGVGDAALAYLPLYQPSWTIPLDHHGKEIVERVNCEMLRRADVVLCLTPSERRQVHEIAAPAVTHGTVVVPGCDFSTFSAGEADRPPDLLFVGDYREPRKRFDRVLAVFRRLREQGTEVRLILIGNESHCAAGSLTAAEMASVVALGYVEEERLRQSYREAAVLLLLSEYEAFGLPVIEALASATPVVMSTQPAPETVFGDSAYVRFVDGDNIEQATETVRQVLAEGVTLRQGLIDARAGLAARYDWEAVAARTRNHLLAAWARRRRASGGFAVA